MLITKATKIAQYFEKKLNARGGYLGLTKYFWYLITWDWDPSGTAAMLPISNYSRQIPLKSYQDIETKYTIHLVEVTESYRTIGSYQTPTRSMDQEIKIKEQTILRWGSPLQTSTIYPHLVYKAYETILVRKIGFSLTNTTLTNK